MNYKSLIAVTVQFFLIAAFKADAQIISTFDTDNDGWMLIGICQTNQAPPDSTSWAPSYSPAGGNQGGYIWQASTNAGGPSCGSNNPVWTFFQAPAKFLDNRSNYYGGSLSFDIRRHIGTLNNFRDVFLEGGGITLVIDARPGPAAENVWTEYSIPLRTSSSWHTGTSAGAQPSVAVFQSVLGNLTAIRIRGEYNVGADAGDLDNVVLSTNRSAIPQSAIEKAVQICWDSKVGETYQVQFQSALTTNAWVSFGSPVAGNGTNNCVFDSASSPKRFYQVIVVP